MPTPVPWRRHTWRGAAGRVRLSTSSRTPPRRGAASWARLTPWRCRSSSARSTTVAAAQTIRPRRLRSSRTRSYRGSPVRSLAPASSSQPRSDSLFFCAGAGADVDRLGHEMRSAWLSFACTGAPAAESWPVYNAETRPTMVSKLGLDVSLKVIVAYFSYWFQTTASADLRDGRVQRHRRPAWRGAGSPGRGPRLGPQMKPATRASTRAQR